MSIRATNKEVPVCPECHLPLRESTSDLEAYKFNLVDDGFAPSATVTCLNCRTSVRVTVKRLYDTEVVR